MAACWTSTPGRLGGPVEVARMGQLQRPPDQVDRRRIFKGEIVDVVGDHHETRRATPARMIEPEEQHPGRIRDRPLLGKGFVLALGVAVRVRDGLQPGVALQVFHTKPPFRRAGPRDAPPPGKATTPACGGGRSRWRSDGRSARGPHRRLGCTRACPPAPKAGRKVPAAEQAGVRGVDGQIRAWVLRAILDGHFSAAVGPVARKRRARSGSSQRRATFPRSRGVKKKAGSRPAD
jgi:hypothetical protein